MRKRVSASIPGNRTGDSQIIFFNDSNDDENLLTKTCTMQRGW